MKRSLLLCLAFHIPSLSFAGPFGLEMGMTLTELSKVMKLKSNGEYRFTTGTVPKPHPDYDSYNFVVTPTHGLCKIIALSRTLETSAYGTELINAFAAIESTLSSKYGTPQKFDFLKPKSIWHEPNEWFYALIKNERVLTSFWTNDINKLPDNLTTITLDVHALSPGRAVTSIKYDFKNINQCIDWIAAQGNSAL